MKKKRIIPILLLKNGWLVQSKEFSRFQNLGNPVTSVKRISEWAADELIYLDISRDNSYDLRRDDLGHPNRHTIFEILDDVSKMANMPITVGGGIKTLNDIQKRLAKGADKVAINTAALANLNFVTNSAKEFGSQCIVISIDVKLFDNVYAVMSHYGQKRTQYDPVTWAKLVEKSGAGELLLNSIDRDGMKTGYDIQLLNSVVSAVSIPVIACGGVGEWSHFAEALEKTKVDAIAAANIFQYSDQSVYLAKKYLYEHSFPVRPPDLMLI
ncbi:TPA: imidazole glycerol phosphate synthase subunit HisF [Patescibacteria group bacterium]|uniref:imidazole glycerol-phosphate synthase n=1 Tax=Candidatus Gottesmanbacteria bacterium GW2011_GWA1_43_11 TaxID=1618436 RepID=A0A0G1ETB6_9BACT|nr:MAG: Imidazole glycerol phosphate synthase subunit [Candidatus Gottesmanbacteria bacterium GW2011_GWA1_43_11]HCS79110.1 imidazole glycerol phosphate synthase subunit HisF [Patescibacteria group bacterium]